jgi:hypothetical protein
MVNTYIQKLSTIVNSGLFSDSQIMNPGHRRGSLSQAGNKQVSGVTLN